MLSQAYYHLSDISRKEEELLSGGESSPHPATPATIPEAEGLPEFWEAKRLNSGKVVFINHIKRTTQFERPETTTADQPSVSPVAPTAMGNRAVPDVSSNISPADINRNHCRRPRAFMIIGFGGELKDVKVLCPAGHVLKCTVSRDTWTCSTKRMCRSDCGERGVGADEGIEQWTCGFDCYTLCEACKEKQRETYDGAEFEIQCPWNHKMSEYQPNAAAEESPWCCNFPPQGDCIAGMSDESQYPENEAWRCIEDFRVKTGGECNMDLCRTCVEAMIHRAKIHLSTSLQRLRAPPQVEESPKGKIFFKVVNIACL